MAETTEPRAVLWDMDGTLIDSGQSHYAAWRETLAGEGIELSLEGFARSFGQRNDEILRGHFGPAIPPEEIARIGDAKEIRYRDLVRSDGVELLPGVRAWLLRLQSDGWRQAIASSAPRRNIETILDVLGLTDLFDATASAEDVRRGKPDPQIYLVAAALLAVEPRRCIVVEDAPAGVESGRRAGMRVVGVRYTHEDLEADETVDTLDQLPPDGFDRLLV